MLHIPSRLEIHRMEAVRGVEEEKEEVKIGLWIHSEKNGPPYFDTH